MNESVKIVECPRDAWQGLPAIIPAPQKACYLQKLIAAGFTTIDAVSFVSPAAVPQMADSEQVLELLDVPENLEIIGIVVNEKGAERAIEAGVVQTLGFPYSISPEFLRRNQKQTQEEALRVLGSIAALAEDEGRNVVAYISMTFGNPYGDPCSIEAVVQACRKLTHIGIWQISLADTVGLAMPAQIEETVTRALEASEGAEIGVHLHSRPQDAALKIRAAYRAGCRRFDSAIGGLGGCPFAQDALVGNIATETLIAELNNLGADVSRFEPLDELRSASAAIATDFGTASS
ncbi:MAG: hydroxymethylglutaryl-CoA lyase [Terracidiphilus sp.]|jgi:hydroxymethylglutaryl-CoA lyase